MNIKQYFGSIKAGVALALGFAGSSAPEFIKGFGETGSEGEVDFEKSTFEVTTNMVKRQESNAFGKLVGNVHIAIKHGDKTEQVRVDMGTFATLLKADKNKAVLCGVQVKNADGSPYLSRSGKPLYNLVAKEPIAYSETLVDELEALLTKLAPVTMK